MDRRTRIVQAVAVASLLAGTLCAHDAAAQATAAPAQGDALRITFERPAVYSGETQLSSMGQVAFAEKRGVTIGALLRVTNVSSTPVYICGENRDALAVGIEVPIGGGWTDLPLATCGTRSKPIPLATGESLELQVPLPASAPTIRINLTYWTSADPNGQKGGSLTASSAAIDVHRWSGGRAPAGAATQRASAASPRAATHETASVSTPAPAMAPGVHLTFDRIMAYSGKTSDGWTASYAFVDNRGVTIGALLRLTNATSAPIWVLGSSRDALSVNVEVRQRNDWRGLVISESSADLKPIAIASGETVELQVPLPDDARNMRVSIMSREVDNPNWTTGGWHPVYSDSIDVRRWKK